MGPVGRHDRPQGKDDDYYSCERWVGTFARSVALPAGIEADKVE
jgi:HSP20 family molecular chaperone IbpA